MSRGLGLRPYNGTAAARSASTPYQRRGARPIEAWLRDETVLAPHRGAATPEARRFSHGELLTTRSTPRRGLATPEWRGTGRGWTDTDGVDGHGRDGGAGRGVGVQGSGPPEVGRVRGSGLRRTAGGPCHDTRRLVQKAGIEESVKSTSDAAATSATAASVVRRLIQKTTANPIKVRKDKAASWYGRTSLSQER